MKITNNISIQKKDTFWKCPNCGIKYKDNPKLKKKVCEECGLIKKSIKIPDSK